MPARNVHFIEALRAALHGPVANLLEDLAAGLWLRGADEIAGQALVLATELRGSADPETVVWVGRVPRVPDRQTLAYMQRQQQQRGQRQQA